ncbi:hypothetical protein OE88DRAFT_47864 [Heliocybe sulcata]|uniref:Uncharacterized protein n=1 Tax=Heliocybe sulcata TaxID=5364 RepID=A0A5C3NJN5_9AGAM|nr:hypothetical protein OE88DRAFT_47864 [Heliocybe sulcata]
MSAGPSSSRHSISAGNGLIRPYVHRQQTAYRVGDRRLSEAGTGYRAPASHHSHSTTLDTHVDQLSPEVGLAWGHYRGIDVSRPNKPADPEYEIHEDVKRTLLYQRRARERKAAESRRQSLDEPVPGLVSSHRNSISSVDSSHGLRTPKTSPRGSQSNRPTDSQGRHSVVQSFQTPKPAVAAQSRILEGPLTSSPPPLDETVAVTLPRRKSSVSNVLNEVSKRLAVPTGTGRRRGSVAGSRSRSSIVLHGLMHRSSHTSPTAQLPAMETIHSGEPLPPKTVPLPKADVLHHRNLLPLPRFNPFMRFRAESLTSLDVSAPTDSLEIGRSAFEVRRLQSNPLPRDGRRDTCRF